MQSLNRSPNVPVLRWHLMALSSLFHSPLQGARLAMSNPTEMGVITPSTPFGKAMDIRFLKWVDVGHLALHLNGGTDVNIYSGGEIDGNGQAWSSDIVFDSMYLNASSSNGNPTANSDGWDTYRSDNIVIQNSRIFNSDDCVSFKPNSTNIVLQNLYCNGSHGISVGSLRQYVSQVDIVENILVYNTSLNNASVRDPPPLLRERKKLTGQDGARIKSGLEQLATPPALAAAVAGSGT
ncbi:hypothetical protein CFD26_103601 [Aspergillus turcosus]|uniref:galacturonan 1,4-alpha-galacturonidase n=1 Tax=Aspergillus turcosus TaxID=1245748 RepID=A0A421CY76_9EURO|nr:hypothetical protein CFD26_103601 [Aspergillus turcosus]